MVFPSNFHHMTTEVENPSAAREATGLRGAAATQSGAIDAAEIRQKWEI